MKGRIEKGPLYEEYIDSWVLIGRSQMMKANEFKKLMEELP